MNAHGAESKRKQDLKSTEERMLRQEEREGDKSGK